VSLINKVLHDLEAQRELTDAQAERSALAHEELRPVAPRPSRRWWLRLALLPALVAAGAFAWWQWGAKPPPAATAPAATPPAAPAVAAKPAAEPPENGATPPRPAEPLPSATIAETPEPVAPPRDVVVRKPQTESFKPAIVIPPAPPPAPAETAAAQAKETAPAAAPDADELEEEPVAKPKVRAAAKPAEAAKPAGRPVLDKKVKPLTPEERAESEYRLAAMAVQQRRAGEAESRLRAALNAQPAHVKARELLAGLMLQGGRWREAQSLLEQGVALHPEHYPFAQLLARAYVDRGQEEKALALLEKSRAAAGGDPEYLAFLATLYQRAGRQDDAARNFSEALKQRPQEGRWWLGLAISLEAAEKWKESAEAYQRAAASGNLDKQLLLYARQRLAVVKGK
jgi:MSHA biogenesis protein MshN